MISVSCWWVCEPEQLQRGILKEPNRGEQLPSKMKCALRDAQGCVFWETCTKQGRTPGEDVEVIGGEWYRPGSSRRQATHADGPHRHSREQEGTAEGLDSMILFLYGIKYAKPYFTLFMAP